MSSSVGTEVTRSSVSNAVQVRQRLDEIRSTSVLARFSPARRASETSVGGRDSQVHDELLASHNSQTPPYVSFLY